MSFQLLYTLARSKYCVACILSVGVSYIILNNSNIFKYLRFCCRPKRLFKRRVTYVVSSISETNFAVEQLKREITIKRIIGLDCEWVSTKNKRHPVALLQLSAPDGFCSLFRLSSLKCVPAEIMELLEDDTILKVGVAVVTDGRYLMADYNVNCKGCLDLRHLAVQIGIEPRGLSGLSEELFGIELDKSWRVRCSNWEAETLSSKQIQYAADDAFIALDIFDQLNDSQLRKKYSIWKRFFWTKTDYWQHSFSMWLPFLDMNYNSSRGGSRSQTDKAAKKKPVDTIIKRNYNTLLHKQHYSNIFLLAPDNQVLCTISSSKATWYIEKELVDIICDDPKTLKLRFEPSNRSNEPDGYYTKPKENKCVVCGCGTDLRRKNVVPVEYRRYFEENLKNHQSHDILLMCVACHTRSNMYDQMLRDQLVEECDAPLADRKNNKLCELPEVRAVRSAARALYYNGDVIPLERRTQLEKVICDKLGMSSDQLTLSFLETVIDAECFVESDKYIPHGLKVVQHYTSKRVVEDLERRWRQHFLTTMSPKYLPQLWSVNHIRD